MRTRVALDRKEAKDVKTLLREPEAALPEVEQGPPCVHGETLPVPSGQVRGREKG